MFLRKYRKIGLIIPCFLFCFFCLHRQKSSLLGILPFGNQSVSNVSLYSIEILPTSVTLKIGQTQQFQAQGLYSDGTKADITNSVTWASSDSTKLSIDATGLGKAIAPGTSNIVANQGTISSNIVSAIVSSASLTSITISSSVLTVYNGQTLNLTATGTYSDSSTADITNSVTWSSDNISFATINTTGQLQSLAQGTVNISASLNGINSNSLAVTINPATLTTIVISSTTQTISNGQALNFTAIGTYSDSATVDITNSVTWSSDNTSYATINSSGRMQALALGIVNISGSLSGISSNTIAVTISDTVKPYIVNVSSLDTTTIRVIFSETVTGATTATNYKIVDSPATGNCSDNSNFTSSSQTVDFTIISVAGTNNTYDITLSGATQVTGKNYSVIVNKPGILDLVSNTTDCPNNADFVGNEQLKVISAACVDTTHVALGFSKPIKTGSNVSGSAECSNSTECGYRYKLAGATVLGNISSVSILDGTNCGGLPANTTKVCISHANVQNGGIYSVVAANGTNGDGFDNSVWGSVQNSSGSESVQLSPSDRVNFAGCGSVPTDFTSPISQDPFADTSSFGYLNVFGGKVYIGPNSKGNGAFRFNADGSSPENLTFAFNKDITGGRTSSNSAATRDGGIAVPPYVSIGFSGCTSNNADLATGCGPDNNNGRGIFASGMIGGTEYLFITGARSSGNNDYLYWTSDSDTNLNFNYLDASAIFDSASVGFNIGTESIVIFNNKIYWMSPGSGSGRPYFTKLNDLTAESVNTTNGVYIDITNMDGFGRNGANPNYADYVGGTMFVFNNRLYIANSGAISNSPSCDINTSYSIGVCEQIGGVIRSTNTDPGVCCADWIDISPSNTSYKNSFSNVLGGLSDLTPAQRPIPKFESYQSKLYLIRNSCQTSRWNRSCMNSGCNDDQACPSGQEVPQLWKCDPSTTGSATDCDAGDWSLVAQNGATGKTNFGDTNNTKVTMLQANGSYLYVGFDNATDGVKIYRSNIANPTSESDFAQIGGNGLGDPANNKEIYSSVAYQNYVYISVGFGGTPVKVQRQWNN